MTELETLKSRVEQLAHDLAESRKSEMSAICALADIREACGDNGRRMLPDLVEHVRECYELSIMQRRRQNEIRLQQAAQVLDMSACHAILNAKTRSFTGLDGR